MAVLLARVTFTAGFTLRGGFDSNSDISINGKSVLGNVKPAAEVTVTSRAATTRCVGAAYRIFSTFISSVLVLSWLIMPSIAELIGSISSGNMILRVHCFMMNQYINRMLIN